MFLTGAQVQPESTDGWELCSRIQHLNNGVCTMSTMHVLQMERMKLTLVAIQDVHDVTVGRWKRKWHQADLQRNSIFFILQKSACLRAGGIATIEIHADASFVHDKVCLIHNAIVYKLSPAHSYLHKQSMREENAFAKRNHAARIWMNSTRSDGGAVDVKARLGWQTFGVAGECGKKKTRRD